jgi:hypothetical protein
MVNLKAIILFIFLFTVFSVPVIAISVSPANMALVYDPQEGIDAQFDLRIGASSPNTATISINLTPYDSPFALPEGTVVLNESQMKQYVKLSDSSIDPSRQNTINVKVKIPPHTPLYGPQIFGISIVERPSSASGFLTITTAALFRVSIDAPYPDQYLDITKFRIDNVNEGESSKLYWQVIGRSSKETFFNANLVIKSKDGRVVFERDLGSNSVERQEVYPLDSYYESLPTNTFVPDAYEGTLTVKFANNVKTSTTKFNVGTQSVSLENYAPKTLVYGEINQITLTVMSLWNGQFNNVHGTIELMGDNITTIKSTTPSGVLTPFGTLDLAQYMDIRSLPEGKYKANITINFDEYSMLFPAEFTVAKEVIPAVEEAPKKINSKTYLTIGVVVGVLILVALVLFLLFGKKKGGENQKVQQARPEAQQARPQAQQTKPQVPLPRQPAPQARPVAQQPKQPAPQTKTTQQAKVPQKQK